MRRRRSVDGDKSIRHLRERECVGPKKFVGLKKLDGGRAARPSGVGAWRKGA